MSSLKPLAQVDLVSGLESEPGDAESGHGRRAAVLLVEEPNSPEPDRPLETEAQPTAITPPHDRHVRASDGEDESAAAPVAPKPGSLWRAGLRLLFGK